MEAWRESPCFIGSRGKNNSMGDAGKSFFGREKELLFFERLLAARPADRSSVVVVRGGSGLGKTRMLQEFGEVARRNGVVAVYGSAFRAVRGRAYGIWEQIVGELASVILPVTDNGDLELSFRSGTQSVDRAEFFGEAADHLRDAAGARPLVVLLDNLEQADAESLLMLRYLGAELAQEPCIFIGALGTGVTGIGTTPAKQLEKLLGAAHVIELEGLGHEAIDSMVGRAEAVAFLQEVSGGNPLMITELLASGQMLRGRLPMEQHADFLALAEVRLAALDPDVVGMLVALAVFERPPTLAELAGCAAQPVHETAGALDLAVAGGIVAKISRGPYSGHFELVHAMMRAAVLDWAALSQIEAARQRRVADPSLNPAERARHLLLMQGSVTERLQAVLDAANESLESFAFEEAVELGELALASLPDHGPGGGPTAARIALAVGQAYWRIGSHARAEESYRRASQLLGRSGYIEVDYLIALGPHLEFDLSGLAATQRAQQCLAALSDGRLVDGVQRVKLLATLALAQDSLDPEQAMVAAAEAMAASALVDDPVARAYAMAATAMTDMSPHTVGMRHDAARHILAVVEQHNEFRLASVGYFLLLRSLLEKGDIQELDLQLTHRSDVLDRFPELHQSKQAHWFRCLRAILDGDTVLAEQLVLAAHAEASATQEASADAVLRGQMGIIRWMQGHLGDVEGSFLRARRENPEERIWAASLVWLWHKQGRDDAAVRLLETLTDLDAIPRNRMWLSTMTALAEIASEMGSEQFARGIRDALLPYAQQVIPLGVGVAFWGTVGRSLGLLAERLGLVDEAREHLRTAMEISARSGAQAWLAEAQIEYAEFSLRHAESRNYCPAEARQLLEQALVSAKRRSFRLLQVRAESVLSRLEADPAAGGPQVITAAPSQGHAPADGRARVRVMGAFDVVSHQGQRARWTSRKARELLKILVSMRGVPTSREVFMDALWPGQAPEALANRFAVAINTVRRAMDPARDFPPHHFLVVDAESVRLQLDHVDVDVEVFMALARGTSESQLRRAAQLYVGDVFAEEPYADWAGALRHEAQLTYCQLALVLARQDAGAGDLLSASQLYRAVLDIEPENRDAGQGLLEALTAMGAHGQAREVAGRMGAWEQEAAAATL